MYRYTKERNINELCHNSMYGYENNRNSPVYQYTRTAPESLWTIALFTKLFYSSLAFVYTSVKFYSPVKTFFFCDLCRCHFILCHQILVLLVVLLHNFTKHILEIVVTIVFSLFHRIFLLTYDSTSLLSTTFNTTLHFELIYGETL